MTMAIEPADEDAFADVFSSERDNRSGREPPAADPDKSDQGADRKRDDLGRFAARTEPAPAEATPPPADIKPPDGAPPPAADPQQQPPDPNANRHVPLSELLAERKQRQQYERAAIEAEARAKAIEQMLQQQSRHAQQPQPQQQPVPDPLLDPQEWANHVQGQLAHQMRVNNASVSRRFAEREHGRDVVQKVLETAPVDLCNHLFRHSSDPFAELMDWYKDQQVRKEVGTDLDAFKKRIEDEVRQKVLAELKAGGANGQPPTSFPAPLTTATASGPQGAHLTDEAAMAGVFASGRNRRAG